MLTIETAATGNASRRAIMRQSSERTCVVGDGGRYIGYSAGGAWNRAGAATGDAGGAAANGDACDGPTNGDACDGPANGDAGGRPANDDAGGAANGDAGGAPVNAVSVAACASTCTGGGAISVASSRSSANQSRESRSSGLPRTPAISSLTAVDSNAMRAGHYKDRTTTRPSASRGLGAISRPELPATRSATASAGVHGAAHQRSLYRHLRAYRGSRHGRTDQAAASAGRSRSSSVAQVSR